MHQSYIQLPDYPVVECIAIRSLEYDPFWPSFVQYHRGCGKCTGHLLKSFHWVGEPNEHYYLMPVLVVLKSCEQQTTAGSSSWLDWLHFGPGVHNLGRYLLMLKWKQNRYQVTLSHSNFSFCTTTLKLWRGGDDYWDTGEVS